MISSCLVGETGRACRELEIQVKLRHEISFLTGILLHRVEGSYFSILQCNLLKSMLKYIYAGVGEFQIVPALTNVLPGQTGQEAEPCE